MDLCHSGVIILRERLSCEALEKHHRGSASAYVFRSVSEVPATDPPPRDAAHYCM